MTVVEMGLRRGVVMTHLRHLVAAGILLLFGAPAFANVVTFDLSATTSSPAYTVSGTITIDEVGTTWTVTGMSATVSGGIGVLSDFVDAGAQYLCCNYIDMEVSNGPSPTALVTIGVDDVDYLLSTFSGGGISNSSLTLGGSPLLLTGTLEPGTSGTVPEPASWTMLLVGASAVGFAAWRRSRRARASTRQSS